VRALARFLAGDESAKGEVIDLLAPGSGGGGGPGAREGVPPGKGWKWALTIGGGVALATGVVLVVLYEPQEINGMRNPNARATLVPGLIIGGVGAVAAGIGTYLLITHPSHKGKQLGFVPTSGGGVLTLQRAF
jgi:hypothetical protein